LHYADKLLNLQIKITYYWKWVAEWWCIKSTWHNNCDI